VSAICGLFHLDGRPPSDAIGAMSAALAHRGVDGSGIWVDDRIGLAHRMFHTTHESIGEHQPVVLPERQLVLVADARIDNREELRRALGIPARNTMSDSDIVLAAYARWGEACVPRLLGDFAFALWDGAARSLFCARDPMGVKPFYYFASPRVFAFASEIKALLTVPGVEPPIDPEQVALFLDWHHEDRAATIYRGVLRLPAAHTLRVTSQGARLSRYWDVANASEVRFATDDEYIEAFRSHFASAVHARMRCAHPIGATLSGGLDSSAIVCMSRKLRRDSDAPLHTFSIVFPDLPERELRMIDERRFVEAVVRTGGVEPHFVRGDTLSPMRDARRMLWHLDEPYSTPNLYLHCGLFEAAQSSSVRVLLDGFDGDSVVSHGVGRLSGLARTRQWELLDDEIRAFSAHHGKSPALALHQFVLPQLALLARRGRPLPWLRMARELARRFGLSRREIALRFGVLPLMPAGLRRVSRMLKRDLTVDGGILRPDLARGLQRHRRAAEREQWRSLSEREEHVRGLSHPLFQLTLEIADKAAASYGVEPRYPFFDRRLIEFCVGLPESQKFDGGWPRLLFRRAMEGILPPEIQWRASKANLGPNFHRRFRAIDLANREAFDNGPLAPYVQVDNLSELLRRYRGAAERQQTTADATLLFRAAILEMWLERQSSGHQALRDSDALSPAAA
jgi:asparagine synthase (glutamine-hydrolysing)